MSKYINLASHLGGLQANKWTVSFAEIEGILGFPLPKSAYEYPAWWANQTGEGHSHCGSWMRMGWRTENLNLSKREVTFIKIDGEKNFQYPTATSERMPDKMTIAEAKLALASNYGVPPENIEITIKG